MESLLSARDIVKKYGDRTVLSDVSLEVERKDSVALLGPNGSGKTTLLQILAGIQKPSSGKVFYRGHEVDKPEALRHNCTMVFQTPVMFKASVNYNVSFGLRLRHSTANEIRERVQGALRKVEMEGYNERSATELSGGEQQRVSIARALALEPEILLLDEPTSNLDPRSVATVERILETIRQDGSVTTILATHRIDQAERICDEVALLVEGRIVRHGSTREVLASQDESFQEYAYLGNLFAGRVVGQDKGVASIRLQDGIMISATTAKKGAVTARIRIEDIIISLDPVATSAQNVLPARVVGVMDEGPSLALHVDAGVPFIARITHKSYGEMGLGPGSSVFLVFKASAVEVL